MKKLALVLSLLLLLVTPIHALTGVGALADRISTATLVQVTGKTAPWAEVVIVNPNEDDRIYVTAEIEPDGDFTFQFRVSNATLGQLQIFAIDELGTTSRVRLADYLNVVILLPPTIVNDLDDPQSSTRVALTGFTYPGSTITLHLTSDQGFDDSFTIIADSITGRWRYQNSSLPPGRYTGTARSQNGNLLSELSQEIYFEITTIPIPPIVIDVIEEILDVVPEAVREIIVDRQEEIAQVLAPAAAAPVVAILLQDLIAILLKLLLGLLHLLGWRKDRRSWGVVYDAITKDRLTRAIVRLYQAQDNKLVETDVTGNEGIFAFLPQVGRYFIKVVKPGYEFPSQFVRGSGRDGEYEYVYHGEVFEVGNPDEQLRLSIPLDPIKAKVTWWFYLKRLLARLWNALGIILLLIGFTFALSSILRIVSLLNILVLLFYVVLLTYQLRTALVVKRRFGIVRDSATNDPVPNVSIALYEVEFNRLIQRRVSNDQGKFLLVVPGGRYKLEVAAVDWVADYETGAKKKAYGGQEIIVKGERTQAVKVTIYVKKRGKG